MKSKNREPIYVDMQCAKCHLNFQWEDTGKEPPSLCTPCKKAGYIEDDIMDDLYPADDYSGALPGLF